MILIAAGVAAVVIIGLVLGYAALHGGKPTVQPSAGTSGATSTGATPTPTPVALLDDNSMINAQMARQIDPKRSWQVASTQHGLDTNSPRAACFGSDPVDGQPDPQQVLQRLLSSSGQNPPALLHQAESYETSEDAAQAYVAISKALGTCAVVGSWIESGRTVNGLGDQSAGAVVTVTDSGKQTYHGMVISRTGRVVDIVDVAQTGSAPSMGNTAGALAQADRCPVHDQRRRLREEGLGEERASAARRGRAGLPVRRRPAPGRQYAVAVGRQYAERAGRRLRRQRV